MTLLRVVVHVHVHIKNVMYEGTVLPHQFSVSTVHLSATVHSYIHTVLQNRTVIVLYVRQQLYVVHVQLYTYNCNTEDCCNFVRKYSILSYIFVGPPPIRTYIAS